MKLVELLARELKAWPDGAEFYCQDYNRNAYPYEVKPERHEHRDVLWGCKGQLSGVSAVVLSDIASDHATAIVTRSDWAAERARIAKPAKKADKDGWIRHRGGECPVEAGALVDVRHRDGDVFYGVPALEVCGYAETWGHRDCRADIMAYRLHKPAEQVEAFIEAVHAFNALSNVPQLDGPTGWRDRITEIDATTQALATERAELVQKLAGEGFALIGRVVEPVEDMSDWWNWKVGDLLEMVKAGEWEEMTNGKLYKFAVPENRDNFAVIDDDGELRSFSIGLNNSVSCDFKWHSRPSA